MFERLRQWWHCRTHQQDYQKKWPELPVHYLVYYNDDPKCGAVIVFVDWTGDLDWQRDDRAVEVGNSKGIDGSIATALSEAALLEPRVANWPKDLKLSVKRLLGEAIARAFCGEADCATNSLKETRKFIRDKGKEVSRYWTLQLCAACAAIGVIAATLGVLLSERLVGWFGRTPYLMFLAACCGGVGAFLSIVLRLGKLGVDARAERRLHYAEAAARIAAGCICGVLVGAMVKLGVLFTVFAQSGFLATAICTAAIFGGASERLVPGMIAKVESEESKEKGG